VKIHAGARTCPHCRAVIVSRVLEGGRQPTAVAREFRVSVPTVRKWVRRFQGDGLEGLRDNSSRPHRIPRQLLKPGKELHDAVMSVLHTPPTDCGFNRTTWRLRDLQPALVAKGVQASPQNIRQVIRDAGYQWKKARISLTSNDPEYRSKLDAIKVTLANLEPDEAFFSIRREEQRLPEEATQGGSVHLEDGTSTKPLPRIEQLQGLAL